MKKRLAIFPFYEDLMPVIRYRQAMQDYELVHAVLPKGWEVSDHSGNVYKPYYCSEDAFYSDNLIASVDVLLLCKPVVQVDKSIYSNIIAIAEQNGKGIMYVPELDFLAVNHSKDTWTCLGPVNTKAIYNKRLLQVDVPVVMVLGMGENCGKLEIQLDLCDFFHGKGYKATLISSNPLAQLMGHHALPGNLDSNLLTFSEQVGSLKAYVKSIESEEHPDVIILGVPGGIVKYSETIPNGYGYLPFLIANAVKPDITVLSLYCGKYEESHIQEIQTTCRYRFGAKADYFHISQKACEYSFETGLLNYFSVDLAFLKEIIGSQGQFEFFNSLDVSKNRSFEKILLELQTNVASI